MRASNIFWAWVLLSSCVGEAPNIKAPRSLLEESTRPVYSTRVGDQVVDPIIRSISFIIFPVAEDLKEFEYRPGEEVMPLWDSLASDLPYGEHLTRNYRRKASEEAKLSDLVTTILTVGELRTNIFREVAPLQQRADTMAETIKSENASLKGELKKISCFYGEQAEDGTYSCQWEQAEDNGLREKALSSCRTVEQYRFPTEASEHGMVWEGLTRRCRELEEVKQARREILGQIDARGELRQEAESVLLELLFAAEEHVRDKSFFVLGASKEKESGDATLSSSLAFDRDTGAADGLHLFLDFGSHYSVGAGLQEYSTANGKITDLRLEKRDWADILKFTLHTADFMVEASLSMTVQEHVDLRFVGDIRVSYPDGSVSGGVMSLELDFQ